MGKQRSLVIVSKALAPYRVQFYSEVAKALRPDGWRVTLVVAMYGAKDHPWANPGMISEYLDIRCAYDGQDDSLVHQICGRFALFFGIKNVELPNLSLIEILNELRADVVWTHEYSPFCLAAAAWASLRDRHCILSTDLGAHPPPHSCTALQLSMQKTVSFLYEGVIANTAEATRRTHPAGVPVTFAPHAIDTDLYFPYPEKNTGIFRFLFAGGIRKEKGIVELVAACDLLAGEGHRFILRTVGTGPLAEWLAGQKREWLSIGGFIEGEALCREYRDSDAYVLPTEGDTYGVTVHEAAASGLPLIVGHAAGAVETLVEEGITGFAIDPKSVQGLTSKMRYLLTNREAAQAMGHAARQVAEKYDVKLLGRRTAKFILHLAPVDFRLASNRRSLNSVSENDGLGIQSHSSEFGTFSNSGIAVVFATMNRAKVAVECLRLLSIQSQRPGKLFVTDNASIDGTAEALGVASHEHGLALGLIHSSENFGNAGGIKLAIERAFKEGFDAVWILDDDSWPEQRALQELLTCGAPVDGIRTSIVMAPDSNQVSWPCEVIGNHSRWETLGDVSQISKEPCMEVRRSWLGALIPRQAYEEVGPVNGDLFLRGEDEDYPRRMERAGYRFWMAPASVLRHPVSGPVVSIALGDYKLWLEHNLQGDKLYYRIRNMLWIKRDESGIAATLLLTVGYLYLLLRWFRPLFPALRVFREAVLDAFTDRLGKRVAETQAR